ncbi:NADH:flavin oxidoreductase [Novosphingobium colocasiae]|uniref:Oxidoreductase n=1 Tax=Novosphingobium colocasiae TaxID=1256513 RepID=A0A918PA71_9SPHN|nr:NADH:flavin oxidoreductase [Novosphingobium colocasiae]GGY91960.1 oxidoreductase [Novosphingobium colocasiae]
MTGHASPELLFRPLTIGRTTIPNRIAMAPMTRGMSPGGVPGPDVAAYYRRRAEGGVGLIITEGTWIPQANASNDPGVPDFHGEAALAGWAEVVRQVHAAGAAIIPQLWHIGAAPKSDVAEIYGDRPDGIGQPIGPSGLGAPGTPVGRAMTQRDIDDVSEAFVRAAVSAFAIGCDGVELHGAHGYLIDQFFWEETNLREDGYGGSAANRSRFAADIIRAIRAATAPDFPIQLRFSQWKIQDYGAKAWHTPAQLEAFLAPLADAGVDMFHCSQRRFWTPEFDGSDLNLAGWTKHLTGKPTITVGSVSLDLDMTVSLYENRPTAITGIDALFDRMARGEFDMVAIGRALLSDPAWAEKVRRGAIGELKPFDNSALRTLV